MDYSSYKKIEFRRRVFAWAPTIFMFDPLSGTELGYIRMKLFKIKDDIRLYADETKSREIIRIKARSFISTKMCFDVFGSNSETLLFSLQHRGLRSFFKRDYWNILDKSGNIIGAIKETSGALAMARRWSLIIPYIGPALELALAFTPQTFDFLSLSDPNNPIKQGNIVHKKNPFIVKLDTDYSAAPNPFEPKLYIAGSALLSILDASKRR
jgi:hypothetical protein